MAEVVYGSRNAVVKIASALHLSQIEVEDILRKFTRDEDLPNAARVESKVVKFPKPKEFSKR
jgi:hypothetical protein